jgi:alpha-galactosidase
VAKNKITLYKEIREVVQKGDVFRIISPFDETCRSVLQYVAKDKNKSVVFDYHIAEQPDLSIAEKHKSPLVKLRGLDPDKKYKIDKIDGTFTGKYLMEIGIRFPLKGSFKSDIYKIESVEQSK